MIQSFPVRAVREFIASACGGVLYELLGVQHRRCGKRR